MDTPVDHEPVGSPSRWERLLLAVQRAGSKRFRRLGMVAYRRFGDRIVPGGRTVVLLITRGRRTGRRHTVLLESFPNARGMVVVAVNSGQEIDPDWYRNLMAAGGGEIETRGQRRAVRAEPLDDAEAEAFWPVIEAREPSFGRLRRSMRRRLPLVRLVPEAPD